ncbi:hypothetical protein D3C73_1170990 [compost metagenome]
MSGLLIVSKGIESWAIFTALSSFLLFLQDTTPMERQIRTKKKRFLMLFSFIIYYFFEVKFSMIDFNIDRVDGSHHCSRIA